MNRLLTIIIITVIVLTALFLITNPNILTEIWLWIVGLLGAIVALFKNIADFIREQIGKVSLNKNKPDELKQSTTDTIRKNRQLSAENKLLKQKINQIESNLAESQTDAALPFDGITITIIRYVDDGESTLGLLFYDHKFFCYTLEDTYHQEKIPGETRIPGGVYEVDFLKYDTPLTLKYRETRPWFKYHIEIKNIPNYTGVYIHNGSTHEHTEGCILVAGTVNAFNATKMITQSRLTFEKLYKQFKRDKGNGYNFRIKILDESWLEKINFKKKTINA
jgi:regulator of replication initiation timing